MTKEHSNGATASYYELPAGAAQLQDLISHRDMNAQIGEIFRACYRCEGAGCDVANECLRHLSLFDVGPRTPIA